MSTDDPEETRIGLVRLAETAVRALEEAQREDPDPGHRDWYAIAGALDDITHRLAGLTDTVGRQVLAYGDRYHVRDDADRDPEVRAADTHVQLLEVADRLRGANTAARRAHSELSHIAVWARRDDTRPGAHHRDEIEGGR